MPARSRSTGNPFRWEPCLKGYAGINTAGLIAPGTQSASYRENGGGGGISGTYDASRFVGANQHLLFNGAFDYTNSSTNFGGVGAGSSINSNNYSFTGTGLYSNYNTYLALKGSYQFGDNSEFNSSDSSTGSYRSDGYEIDARVGQPHLLAFEYDIAAHRVSDGGQGSPEAKRRTPRIMT
jgi:hypothetical protein